MVRGSSRKCCPRALSGFGALALQYQSANGHVLRIEHHTCDGSIHFHVTDDEDAGSDLVLFADGREKDLLALITSVQDQVTLDNLEQYIPKLQNVARVCLFQGESLVEIEKPS